MSRGFPAAQSKQSPGGLLRHPVAIGAIVVLIVNDHALKTLFPGVVTGKLSDFAGLIFFPLLLAELVVLLSRFGGRLPPVRILVATAIVITAIAFTVVKTTATGGLAFSWGLGAAQWFLTLDFLSGQALRPVAAVVDPTDLIALPALGLSWWVATRAQDRSARVSPTPLRSGPPSRRLAVLLIAAAAFSSLATSQAGPQTLADLTEPFALTEGQPVIVRHISWDVGGLGDMAPGVNLDISVWQRVALTSEFRSTDDAEISFIPDERSYIAHEDGLDWSPYAHDLSDACRAGCSSGATLIIRLAPGRIDATGLELAAQMTVMGVNGADVALRMDPDRAIDDAPSTAEASLAETVRVTDAEPDVVHTAVLTVDGDVLEDPLAFPLLGRIVGRVEVIDGAMVAQAHEAAVGLGDERAWFSADGPPGDLDWLRHCQPGRDCELEVTLQSRFDPTLDGEFEVPEPGAATFVELRWTLDARLEAFDGRPLPDGAVRLELRDVARSPAP